MELVMCCIVCAPAKTQKNCLRVDLVAIFQNANGQIILTHTPRGTAHPSRADNVRFILKTVGTRGGCCDVMPVRVHGEIQI